jgi:hypothetical protein
MKVFMLVTGGGLLAVLTSHESITDRPLLEKFRAKGIEKFVAYEVPLELAQERYGGHFSVVLKDLRETDDLRVLDYNGDRVFRLFRMDELGTPIIHEPAAA